jgi:hypothetical protein
MAVTLMAPTRWSDGAWWSIGFVLQASVQGGEESSESCSRWVLWDGDYTLFVIPRCPVA